MINRYQRTDNKKKKSHRFLRFFLFTLLVLAIGGGIYTYNVYSDVAKAVNKMHKPIKREVSQKREEKVEVKKKDPISILLVGVDERQGDKGRTDSMIIATINPETKTTKLLSIPRDTKTKLINSNNPSKSSVTKINAAYAYGGIEMTIDTVENFLNIPIDYYVEVNMEGFRDIVDALGGIDVNNKIAFELEGVSLNKGPQHLNGEKTLKYVRMRKQDPAGDFGRQERQKEVISQIIEKGASLSSLTKYNDILEALQGNIKTNLSLNDMIGIQADYKAATGTIERLEIKGEGKLVPGDGWYYFVNDQSRQETSNELRAQLGLSDATVAKLNIK
ncbi:LCP family protein [Neobacillus sp. 114]|uniref:LCP family glycopolymer transferase n=1 Tax=Neobacillus sp. 114 TaxID=3048535 RepID=UPI0024C41815|nr:LCP family protein [Neobacillus sp. 114]